MGGYYGRPLNNTIRHETMGNILTKELVNKNERYSWFNHIGLLPNPDKLLTRLGKGLESYRNLKNDPHVWCCIQSRKSGSLCHQYELAQNNASNEVYDFIKYNFSKLDLHSLMRQMLEAVLFGYQPFEIIWTYERYNNKEMLVIEKVLCCKQEDFVYTNKGELRLYTPLDLNGSKIPPYKVLNIRYEADAENPYGQSLLSKCYWSCTFKNSGLRFWVNFIEKFGLPTILAKDLNASVTEEELENLYTLLQKMQQDNTILTTSNVDVTLAEHHTRGAVELYRDLIDLCNKEISKVLLSETLTTEIAEGSYAAAKTHLAIRDEVIMGDLALLQAGMNTLINYIIELNFHALKMENTPTWQWK